QLPQPPQGEMPEQRGLEAIVALLVAERVRPLAAVDRLRTSSGSSCDIEWRETWKSSQSKVARCSGSQTSRWRPPFDRCARAERPISSAGTKADIHTLFAPQPLPPGSAGALP